MSDVSSLKDVLIEASRFNFYGRWIDAEQLWSAVHEEEDVIRDMPITDRTLAFFFYDTGVPLSLSLGEIEKWVLDAGFAIAYTAPTWPPGQGRETYTPGFRGAILGGVDDTLYYGGIVAPDYAGCTSENTCLVVYLFDAPYQRVPVEGVGTLTASSFMSDAQGERLASVFGQTLASELGAREVIRPGAGTELAQEGVPDITRGRIFPETIRTLPPPSPIDSFPWAALAAFGVAFGSWFTLVAGTVVSLWLRDRGRR